MPGFSKAITTPIYVVISFFFILGLGLLIQPKPSPSKGSQPVDTNTVQVIEPISLPKPAISSSYSIEKALYQRRSRRLFQNDTLQLSKLSQLLWAGQGVTTNWGGRTAPSAKSIYPNTLYALVFNVETLNPGLYRYLAGDREPIHQIQLLQPGNFQTKLFEIVNQNSLRSTPVVLLVTAQKDKLKDSFPISELDKNIYLEVGHIAQNIYLQSESIGLGTVAISSFDVAKIHDLLSLPQSEEPVYLMPVGIPKE